MVKADRALTLFMINTLAENARKYTPEGGTSEDVCRTSGRMPMSRSPWRITDAVLSD